MATKKTRKYFNSKWKQIFVTKHWNKSALTVECISKFSILNYKKYFTTLRKLLEKTCCPKINEKKAFFHNLDGLRIPKLYTYLVTPFGHI